LADTLTGLQERANYPGHRLHSLHGSLMNIKCSNKECDYLDEDNTKDPLSPELASDISLSSPGGIAAQFTALSVVSTVDKKTLKTTKPSDTKKPKYEAAPNPLEAIIESLSPTITPEMRKEVIPAEKLPHCPKCDALLRPGVVWFGEPLSRNMFDEINTWIDSERKLDLMMVIVNYALNPHELHSCMKECCLLITR
jgi:NAD-dependent deacetylase sirtuin 5